MPYLSFFRRVRFSLCAASILITACTAPRSITYSPEATPKGKFRVGADLGGNIPTQTVTALYGGLEEGVKTLVNRSKNQDTIPITADSLNQLTRALVAYSLDPLTTPIVLGIRYGLGHRLDVGYKYSGGSIFDLRYQFMGPLEANALGWRGSLALQYSSQKFELPSFFGSLQQLLRYKFSRKDILVPLVLGKPLGAEGRFGSMAMGMAYNLSFVEWDSEVRKLMEKTSEGSTRPFEKLHGERTIPAYGTFANMRLGYRYVYVLLSFSAYWQDYGTYPLFGGETTSLSGWTFQPTAGVEFHF